MTSNFKKSLTYFFKIFAFALILFLGPTFAFAANTQSNPFCGNIDKTITQASREMQTKINKISSEKTKQLQLLQTRRDQHNLQIQKQRAASEKQLSASINRLYKQAKTPAQTQAVDNFKTAVTNAMSIRRASIDQAFLAYRNALDQNLQANQTVIDTAVQNFQSNTTQALNQAKTECAGGTAGKTARQHLISNTQSAQKRFIQSLKINNQPAIQAAQSLDKTAQEATKTFNQSLLKIQAEFRKTFK